VGTVVGLEGKGRSLTARVECGVRRLQHGVRYRGRLMGAGAVRSWRRGRSAG